MAQNKGTKLRSQQLSKDERVFVETSDNMDACMSVCMHPNAVMGSVRNGGAAYAMKMIESIKFYLYFLFPATLHAHGSLYCK